MVAAMPRISPKLNGLWGEEHPFPYYGALVGKENAKRQIKPGETAVLYCPGLNMLEIHQITSEVLTFRDDSISRTTHYYEYESPNRPGVAREAFLGDGAIVRGEINPALGWNRHGATFIGSRGIRTLYQYLLQVEKNFDKAELLERHFPEWMQAPKTILESTHPLTPRKPWFTKDSQGRVVSYLG